MLKTFKRLFFCVFVSQITFSQEIVSDVSLNWSSSYKQALKKSKLEHKPILVYFKGSDWCGPCKVVDTKLFGSERFKELSDKSLILLEVDIPRQTDLLSEEKMSENYYLKEKFNIKSFPTILILNNKGIVLAEKKGYIISDYYYPFIEEVLRKYKS